MRQEKMRREARMAMEQASAKRNGERVRAPLNYDKLPSIDDIYSRTFSGNGDTDPVGGRKRYTYYILYKYDPTEMGKAAFKESREEFIRFLKFKMSCRDIKGVLTKSPIDGAQRIRLEYPMKEYGAKIREGGSLRRKAEYDSAIMMTWNFYAPPGAVYYIDQRIYSDNSILRYMHR